MSNKYINRSRISEAKFRELVKLFVLDLTATQIAELSGLNRNTVNRYLTGIRQRIAEYCEARLPTTYHCSLEKGESANGKCIGVVEKRCAICSMLIERNTAIKSIDNEISAISTLDAIIDIEENEQLWKARSNESKGKRINGFWGYLTTRLEKFKGIHPQTYFLHLKESEFRFNNEKDELYHLVLKIIRNRPLF